MGRKEEYETAVEGGELEKGASEWNEVSGVR